MLCFALAQFLLVARDQVHAEIDRQPHEHRQKRDREDIQVPDHQRRKSHRVSQPDNQTDRRFDGPSRLVVAVNEDERDEDQRHNRGHDGVVLRLRHLIVFQHRFTRDAHIDTGYFGFGLRHQFAQPLHGLVIQVIAPGAGRDDVNATIGERDIDLLLGLLARVKQRRQAGRWRRARALQAVGSL